MPKPVIGNPAVDVRIKTDAVEALNRVRGLEVSLIDVKNLDFDGVIEVRDSLRRTQDSLVCCERILNDHEQVLNRQSAGGLMNKGKRKSK